ncbi:MAG TPA: hypothetical protein VF527_06550, partial [Pyrinomonadaceae bacterium]
MKRCVLLTALLILHSNSIYAQSGLVRTERPRTPVVVNLTEGDPVKGKLIKADSELVILEIGAGEINIKTDKVVSIQFQPSSLEDAPKSVEKEVKSKELVAGEKIVSAMRRMDNAIAVGVTFQNYSQLLIENKTIVDENLKDITDENFRASINRALLDHQYAMSVWNLAVSNG